MSRIGKLPINIPNGVNIEQSENSLNLSGPKGSIKISIPEGIKVQIKDNIIYISAGESDLLKPIHGTFRAILSNYVQGVSIGWLKKLELVGTGYRAEVKGKDLVLVVGYSHPVNVQAPEGIAFKVEKNIITVEGFDKDLVGRISAKVREVRPPEPYKGKGILYQGEVIRRKAGKAAKTQGQAA